MSCVGLWSSPWSVVISWLVVYGHGLGGSVVIFCACGSFPGSCSVVMSWVGLWSSSGSVVISWIVGCGHLLGGPVLILWVCGHFLDRDLWSCLGSVVISLIVVKSSLGWVCGHLLALWSCRIVGCGHVLGVSVVISWVCLWSSPASWSVVMSWVCLWSFPGSWYVVMSWLGLCSWSMVISWVCGHLWVFMSSGSSCLLGFHVFWVFMSSGSSSPGSASSCLGWVCGHLLGLRSLSGSWSVVCPGGFCGHVRSVVIFWVCDHFLDRGLW